MQVKDNSNHSILIISSEFPPGPGGIGNHAFNLAKHLQKFPDISVTVLADSNYTSRNDIQDFDQNHTFAIFRVYRKKPVIFTYLTRIKEAWRLIMSHSQIICSGKFSLWLGGFFSLFFKEKQFVAVVHGSELDNQNKMLKKLTDISLRKFDKVVAVSKYTQSFLPPGLDSVVIANGIDIAAFQPRTKMKAFYAERISLLTVGNVTPRKGQQNLIKALPLLVQEFGQLHYHIVGLPTHKDELLKLGKELGVQDYVTFHGKVSQADLIKSLQACDVFVMLSEHTAQGDFEGFGIAVLEANMYRKPAIGSRNSGIADAISDNKTGILLNPHNPAEIAKALKNISQNYGQYSQEAHAWALKHDWENISQKYYSLLTEDLKITDYRFQIKD